MALLTRTPALPDWRRDERVKALRERGETLDREHGQLVADIAMAGAAVEDAQAAYDEAELAHLSGTGSAEKRAMAQERLDASKLEVRRREALVTVNRRDRGRVDELAVDVVDAAKVSCAAALQALYRDLGTQLNAQLETASETSERLFGVWDAALMLFGTSSETSERGVRHPSYAGLVKANLPTIGLEGQEQHQFDHGRGNQSLFEVWREDGHRFGWLR